MMTELNKAIDSIQRFAVLLVFGVALHKTKQEESRIAEYQKITQGTENARLTHDWNPGVERKNYEAAADNYRKALEKDPMHRRRHNCGFTLQPARASR